MRRINDQSPTLAPRIHQPRLRKVSLNLYNVRSRSTEGVVKDRSILDAMSPLQCLDLRTATENLSHAVDFKCCLTDSTVYTFYRRDVHP